MFKIAFLLIIAAAVFLFFVKGPGFFTRQILNSSNPLTNVLGLHVSSDMGPGDDIKNQGDEIVSQAKDSIQQRSQQAINGTVSDVKDSIFQQAQKDLNKIFGKQTDSPGGVSVQVIDSSAVDRTQPLSVVDISKDDSLKISLSKDSKYFLQFRNIPPNYCLYINQKKYPLENGKVVEVKFSASGSYPITANFCNLNDKNLGELEVR